MRRRLGLLVVLALAVVVGAGACSTSSDRAGSKPTTANPPATTAPGGEDANAGAAEPGHVDWSDCGDGDECGTLEVPVDYDDGSAGTLTLSLVRLPARDPDHRIGALLVNPGGPGGTGVDFARFFPWSADLRDRFDIIGFDPRGVGESTGLTCGGALVDQFFTLDSEPDSPGEQAALDGSAQAIASDCGTQDADLLPYVGSVNVVRDMDSIRVALGEEQISYLGFSYGTLLGALYAEMFPEGARAIVLDGVVDPAQDFTQWLTEQTAGFERAMTAVFDACPDDPSCPTVGAAAAYDQIEATVEAAPLPAGDSVLGPGDLATAALYVTYDPGSWPDFYAALRQGLEGDGSGLYQLAEAYRSFGVFSQYAAVECVDSPHPVGAAAYQAFADQLEAISPRFGGSVANELLACAFWPVPDSALGAPAPITAPDAPPVLVVGNTGDAATPYEQAQRVADTLAHGVLLTYEGEGHTSYMSGSSCVDDAVDAYLVDLTLPDEGTVCR